jgi:hypothetical protein
MSLRLISALAAILLYAGNSHAAGLKIEPGKWKMTNTMTMTMMPQPQVTTSEECIEKDTLDPDDFNDDENPCKISDIEMTGNTAKWAIDCPVENGMVMQGSWEVTSGGDTLTGKGNMSADMAGQKFGFDMSWEGERIGDCD